MPELTVQDVLLRAIDIIHEHGLAKDHVTDKSGAVCAYGALNMALTGAADFRGRTDRDAALRTAAVRQIEHLREFTRSFRDRFGYDPGQFQSRMKSPIAEWNDHPDTTADDVVHMFKYAIEEGTADAHSF